MPNEKGFCSQIHGHRGVIEATIEGDLNEEEDHPDQGMVVNFKDLKEAMMRGVHDQLDHGFAVWKKDEEDREFIEQRNEKLLITDQPPTAEYLAKWAYSQIRDRLDTEAKLVRVTWKETPNSRATYEVT